MNYECEPPCSDCVAQGMCDLYAPELTVESVNRGDFGQWRADHQTLAAAFAPLRVMPIEEQLLRDTSTELYRG